MVEFGPEMSKLSILRENWYTWNLGSADSKSGLRFLKFRPQNSFLGKFGSKMSKLSVLTRNWYTWYLGSTDSQSGLRFLKFLSQNPFWANLGWKCQSCPFFLKIGTHRILTMSILIPILVFWSSVPKSIFGKVWAKKVKVAQFDWKLTHIVYWGCWFLFWQ